MKNKKIQITLAFLTSIILIFTIFVFPANATNSGKLSVTSVNGKQGETFNIDVSIENNPGLITMKFAVSWGEGLELVAVSNSGLLNGWTQPSPTITSPYTLRWADSLATANNTSNGKIATLTFKINNNTNVGQKSVNISFLESRDVGGGKNSFSSTTANISVNCKAHTFGSYSKVSDGAHKRVCSACGYEETANHTWNGGTVTKQANCKEAGNRKYACTACGAERNESIAKTNNHSWGNWNTTKNPTCTATGTATKTCSVCGKTENQTINATGHSMGAWTQSKAPTCTAAGEEKRSCSKCGHSETKAIAALGHSFSHPTVTKEPTCTETGIESGKCTRCGQTTTNTIKAKGHKFGGWNDTKAATCTEGGTQERKCSACNAVETRNTDALGHDFENPTIIKEATISETGLKEGKCKRCGETTSEVIPCSAKDETTGTSFETSEGVFGAGTQLTVEEIKTDNPTFDSAKNILKDVCKEFKLYNISALQNGAAVTPNGEVKTTFTIPEGFGKNVALYLIKADGTSEKVEAEISEDGTTLTAKLTTLGDYAICKLGAAEGKTEKSAKNGEKTSPKTKSNAVLYVIISAAAVLIIGGGATAFITIKKKRKTV